MSPISSGPLSERKEIEVLEESLREQAAEIASLREKNTKLIDEKALLCLQIQNLREAIGLLTTLPLEVGAKRVDFRSDPYAAAQAIFDTVQNEIGALRGQLEVERMRLACCGVIASSNTRASAEAARSVKPEYWSGSAGDVADAVDREMALRDDLAALRERLVEADYELSGEAPHEAGLTYRTVRVGVEWYDAWRASPEVVRALEEK